MTWNIGYGGLGAETDFFYDSGTMVTTPEEWVKKYTAGIDQTVKENDRSWLLARIRKHFSGTSLLYVAGSHSDGNERRARSNGAHYYVSKPLALDRFGHVLQSFLRAQGAKG